MIPILSSLDPDQKPHFAAIFTHALVVVVVLFAGFGALCYAAFGSAVLMPVTLNVQSSVAVDALIRFGYSVAVVFTYPLQLLPIADMLEGSCSKPPAHCASLSAATRRHLSRSFLILFTCLVAECGASQFDRFVSLVGAICGIPLAFILPNLIYLRLSQTLNLPKSPRQLVARVGVVIGVVGSISSGVATLISWAES